MSTVLFMSNRRMQIVEGTFRRSKVKINKVIEHDLPEGFLINGVIIDETNLAESIRKIWAEHKLSRKGLQIVIDSTQFQIKNATFPKLRESAIQELVRNEFIGNERYSDPIFDYMVLRDNPTNPKMMDVLCCGVESSFIHSYVELFQDAIIQIRSIDTALGGIWRMINFLPLFEARTCILLIFNGDNLLTVLLENGLYKYSSRARLLAEKNTVDFVMAIQRAVSSIQQFQAVDSNGFSITDAYFCGCDSSVVNYCKPNIQNLGLNAQLLPDDPSIELNGETNGKHLSDIVFLVGDLMRR